MIPKSICYKVLKEVNSGNIFGCMMLGRPENGYTTFNGIPCAVLFEGNAKNARRYIKLLKRKG